MNVTVEQINNKIDMENECVSQLIRHIVKDFGETKIYFDDHVLTVREKYIWLEKGEDERISIDMVNPIVHTPTATVEDAILLMDVLTNSCDRRYAIKNFVMKYKAKIREVEAFFR